MNKAQRILSVFAFGTLGLAAVTMIYTFYLLFIPPQIVHFNRQPYRVLTPVVKVGGKLIYEADICKYVEAVSQTQRSFVAADGTANPLAANPSNIRTGCHRTHVTVTVPLTMDPGKYHLDIGLSYDVNALRQGVAYHATTEAFMVEK